MAVALPPSLPAPAFDGNVQQEADIAETCEYEAGEDRRAPITRTVPNIVRWSWALNQAQFDDYVDWFEADLQAGTLAIDLPTAEQGGRHSTTTVEALLLAPPIETQLAPDVWRVEAQAVTGVTLNAAAQTVYFRQLMTGTASTSIEAISPQVGPAGFAWDNGTQALVLDGSGAAQAIGGIDGSADSGNSSPALDLTLPTTYRMILEGEAAGSPDGAEGARFVIGTGDDDGVNERFRVQVRSNNTTTYQAVGDWIRAGYGPTGTVEYDLPIAPGVVRVEVRFTPTEFSVWIDGELGTPTSGPTSRPFAPITDVTHIGCQADADTELYRCRALRLELAS